jgi:hypothetical protein
LKEYPSKDMVKKLLGNICVNCAKKQRSDLMKVLIVIGILAGLYFLLLMYFAITNS